MRITALLLKFVTVVLVGAALAGGGAIYYRSGAAAKPNERLQTTPVKRGNLLLTIGATGTIEPEEVVDVGAQVMGLITEFGPDPSHPGKVVDYQSVVEKGALLAKIDPTPYKASLEQAEANLDKSEADRLQLQAKLKQAEREWKRAEALMPKKAIADTDYDTCLSNYESAKASLAAGVATIRQNKACVATANINLNYCTITSPVHGTIIDRRVNIGQTVVANLNAPSLFLIAKDLTRMQVWASVNEADIGQIRLKMPVQFTVDAHPGETFYGEVSQIRMNAQMTQNVVTYTVIVTTDNKSGKLLPYLTANVKFEVQKRSQVLLVPNAALRWTPDAEQLDPTADKRMLADEAESSGKRGRLWVVGQSGLVRPLEVTVGMTDGTMTEISGSGVREGMRVVAGEKSDEETDDQHDAAAADEDNTSNPFLPKPPKGSRPPPGPM
jgi:HlyD family secretion protein